MGNPYQVFATEKDKEVDGVLVPFGGFKLRLARAGGKNIKFVKSVEKHIGSGVGKWGNAMTDDESSAALAEVMVDAVVKGWEGMTDDDGKPMKYDKRVMKEMFLDMPDFLSAVFDEAQKIENYRKSKVEDDKGNSTSGSDGEKSTETSTKT